MNRNIEVEDSLYTELKNISENELDASINKLIDACVENLEIKNDTIVYYKKPKDRLFSNGKNQEIKLGINQKANNTNNRVNRGGNYNNSNSASYRNNNNPNNNNTNNGTRPAL